MHVQVPVIEGAADQLLDGGGAGVRRQKRQIMLVEMVEMVAFGGGRCLVNVSHVHHFSAMFLLSLMLLQLQLSDVHHVVQPHSLLHLVGLWRHRRLTSFARHLPPLLFPLLLLPAPKFSNCQSRKLTLTSAHPFTDGFPSRSASMGFLDGWWSLFVGFDCMSLEVLGCQLTLVSRHIGGLTKICRVITCLNLFWSRCHPIKIVFRTFLVSLF